MSRYYGPGARGQDRFYSEGYLRDQEKRQCPNCMRLPDEPLYVMARSQALVGTAAIGVGGMERAPPPSGEKVCYHCLSLFCDPMYGSVDLITIIPGEADRERFAARTVKILKLQELGHLDPFHVPPNQLDAEIEKMTKKPDQVW